jgi:hypothetical protein
LFCQGIVVTGDGWGDLQRELLANSTPHWSKLSMPHTTPSVKVMCS